MAYTRTTDFLALLRATGDGVRFERMPGLDWLIAGMAAAGMFALSVSADAPTSDQTVTVWFKPSGSGYAAEGAVWLWDAGTNSYAEATPALWQALFAASA